MIFDWELRMDEKQAIDRLLTKDYEGLAWLIERYQLKALRTAFLITHERALADDVVQDKFACLPETILSFDRARLFEPWFLRGVVNAALSAVSRRQDISLEDSQEAERWLENLVAQAPGPEDRLQQAELEGHIWQQMQQLPPQQRAVIVMRYYLEMSEAEMAEVADVPKGTIKWRLNTARARLQKLLSPDPQKEGK
jgi:RNA polymerase sigma-70 factor (ECF subfamily)